MNTNIDGSTNVKLTIPQVVGAIVLIVAMCGNWFSTTYGLKAVSERLSAIEQMVNAAVARIARLEGTIGTENAETREELGSSAEEAVREARRARSESRQAREGLRLLRTEMAQLHEELKRQDKKRR